MPDGNSGSILEFTPGGVGESTTFATGLNPTALAFDSAGNLYVANDAGDGVVWITKIAPDGTPSLFTSGLAPGVNTMQALAFQGESLPVPEPSVLGLIIVSTIAFAFANSVNSRLTAV